jgi:hypothetical protein
MTRQKRWRIKWRKRILDSFGNKCAVCQATEHLELDCREPRGHDHHASGPAGRICFYLREWRAGNLQILCEKHNNLKGDMTWSQWQVHVTTILQRSSNTPSIIPCEQLTQLRNTLSPRDYDASML